MSVKVYEDHTLPSEQLRTGDLLRLLPRGRHSLLDIGARSGYFSRLFRPEFAEVTALDLEMPRFEIPGVRNVAGDVTHLQFADNSFDVVFCAEVLEHVPQLEQACREIARVSREMILIGVPFQQDTRVGRLTCAACGAHNPPNGHVNQFTEAKLTGLFPGCEVVERSLVGEWQFASNNLAAYLQDLAGNPFADYGGQEEGCIQCGAKLDLPPPPPASWRRQLARLGLKLQSLETARAPKCANWIHILFRKKQKFITNHERRNRRFLPAPRPAPGSLASAREVDG